MWRSFNWYHPCGWLESLACCDPLHWCCTDAWYGYTNNGSNSTQWGLDVRLCVLHVHCGCVRADVLHIVIGGLGCYLVKYAWIAQQLKYAEVSQKAAAGRSLSPWWRQWLGSLLRSTPRVPCTARICGIDWGVLVKGLTGVLPRRSGPCWHGTWLILWPCFIRTRVVHGVLSWKLFKINPGLVGLRLAVPLPNGGFEIAGAV